MPLRKTSSSATLHTTALCPGPAYTGIGPSPILSSTSPVSTIVADSPIFAGFSGLGDFFGTDRNIRTPYTQNFNLNIQQQLGRAVLRWAMWALAARNYFASRSQPA